MFDIDKSLEPIKYELTLCKYDKNRTQIAVLQEAYGIRYHAKFGGTDELEFTIPYYVRLSKRKTVNPSWDLIKGEYLILLKRGNKQKYFIINDPLEEGNEKKTMSVKCFSLEYELNNKLIREYKTISRKIYDINNAIDEDGIQLGVLNYVSTLTSWSIGDIDPSILSKFRTFDVSEKTLLDFLTDDVQKSYGCLLQFDTINKRINAVLLENIGNDKGLFITEANYIKSITKEIKNSEIVTRLIVQGKDGVSINGINPSGSNYIEDLSFYKKLEHMLQSTIDALNSYEVLLATKSTEFSGYLSQLGTIDTNLGTKLNELHLLEIDLATIQDGIDSAIRLSQSLTTLNGQLATKQTQINNKKSEITTVENQRATVVVNINTLRNTLAMQNNFTHDQIVEIDKCIHIRTWDGSAYEDEYELLEEAKTALLKVSHPPVQFHTDVVDFLSVVECQTDWDKVVEGDVVSIYYPDFGIDYQVRLVSYIHEPDNNTLDLEFSSVSDIDDPFMRFNDIMKGVVTTSTTLNMDKYKWDKAEETETTLSQFINSNLDAAKNKVLAGKNQSIEISDRGLWARDTVNGLEEIRMINNVMAFTSDGWLTAGLALSGKGIFGEAIFGKIIAGNNLLIENSAGNFLFDKDGFLLSDGGMKLDSKNSIFRIGASDTDFKLKFDGSSLIMGTQIGRQFIVNPDGSVIMPKITTSEISSDFASNLDLSSNNTVSVDANNIDLSANQSVRIAVGQIGGVNLLPNSRYIQTYPNNVGLGTLTLYDGENPYYVVRADTDKNVSMYESDIFDYMNTNCIVGKEYTISVDVFPYSWGVVGFYSQLGAKNNTIVYNWERISYTFTYTSGLRVGGLYCSFHALDYRNWKLEEGKIPTAWTPAREDNIAELNMTPTTITLKAEKIGILGETNIPNLSANKITSGTLDSNLVNVTNLSASNITSGTMLASRINGGDITGVTVTGVTITGGTIRTASSGGIQLTHTNGLRVHDSSGNKRMDILTNQANPTLSFYNTSGGYHGTLSYRPSDGESRAGFWLSSTSTYDLILFGKDVYAKSLLISSDRKMKTNITECSIGDISNKIKQIKTYNYNLKTTDKSKKVLGIMADESPSDILNSEGNAVDLYSYSTLLLQGLQDALQRIEILEKNIGGK